MIIRHLASKYFVHYFIYLDSSSGPSLNTEHVFLHNHCQECLQACTEMYSHIHSLWEYLWEQTVHFHSISLSPIISTSRPFPHHPHMCEIFDLNSTSLDLHNAVHIVHKNLCNLGTFLIWILRHAQCSAHSPQVSFLTLPWSGYFGIYYVCGQLYTLV